jgi:hypothetical protein
MIGQEGSRTFSIAGKLVTEKARRLTVDIVFPFTLVSMLVAYSVEQRV